MHHFSEQIAEFAADLSLSIPLSGVTMNPKRITESGMSAAGAAGAAASRFAKGGDGGGPPGEGDGGKGRGGVGGGSGEGDGDGKRGGKGSSSDGELSGKGKGGGKEGDKASDGSGIQEDGLPSYEQAISTSEKSSGGISSSSSKGGVETLSRGSGGEGIKPLEKLGGKSQSDDGKGMPGMGDGDNVNEALSNQPQPYEEVTSKSDSDSKLPRENLNTLSDEKGQDLDGKVVEKEKGIGYDSSKDSVESDLPPSYEKAMENQVRDTISSVNPPSYNVSLDKPTEEKSIKYNAADEEWAISKESILEDQGVDSKSMKDLTLGLANAERSLLISYSSPLKEPADISDSEDNYKIKLYKFLRSPQLKGKESEIVSAFNREMSIDAFKAKGGSKIQKFNNEVLENLKNPKGTKTEGDKNET